MKSFCIILVLFISCNLFSQSKKKKIILLNARYDSLVTISQSEKQEFNNVKDKIEAEIKNINDQNLVKVREVERMEEELEVTSKKIISCKEQIEKQKNRLLNLKDSIEFLMNQKPLQFLDSTFLNLSEKEILRKMGISASILNESFEDITGENRAPEFYVDKKQVFTLKGKKYAMVFVQVKSPNFVMTYEGTGFLGILQENKGYWSLKGNLIETGGQVLGEPPGLTKTVDYGKNKFAFIINQYNMQGGTTNEIYNIYGIDEQLNIHTIFGKDFDTYFDIIDHPNAPFVGKQIDFQFEKSENEFYDLILTEETTYKNEKTITKKKTLKFNTNKGIYQ